MGWKEGLTAEIWGTAFQEREQSVQDVVVREGACFAQKAETVGQGRGRLEKLLWLLGAGRGASWAPPTLSLNFSFVQWLVLGRGRGIHSQPSLVICGWTPTLG